MGNHIDKLALEQLHIDIKALATAVNELTATIKNKDAIGAVNDAIPVRLAQIDEDALAVLSAIPIKVIDGGTPLMVEVINEG